MKNDKVLPAKSPLVSFSAVIDEELELIRVGGRLQFAALPEETNHRIVLPSKYSVVNTHEKLASHDGPETTFAIL